MPAFLIRLATYQPQSASLFVQRRPIHGEMTILKPILRNGGRKRKERRVTTMKTLEHKTEEVSPVRRQEISSRAAQLVADEISGLSQPAHYYRDSKVASRQPRHRQNVEATKRRRCLRCLTSLCHVLVSTQSRKSRFLAR